MPFYIFSSLSQDYVIPLGFMGAPTVMPEKLFSGNECPGLCKDMESITQVRIEVHRQNFFLNS